MSNAGSAGAGDDGASAGQASTPSSVGGDDALAREAIAAMLRWRRDPALALSARDGAVLESNRRTQELHATQGDRARDDAVPDGARTSRSFGYGGLTLQVLAEPREEEPLDREIPATVLDTVLRMIVEAHFAVWYVWHVPTAFCLIPGFEELLCIPHDAVPTFAEEWFGFVHPEDLPRLVAENNRALRATSSFRSEYRLRRGDGEYIWVSDWAVVLAGPDGEAEWMAGGIRDISTEKALEESRHGVAHLHEALFQRALMPTLLIDGDGTIADANQAATEFFEPAHDGLVGRASADVLHPNCWSTSARRPEPTQCVQAGWGHGKSSSR